MTGVLFYFEYPLKTGLLLWLPAKKLPSLFLLHLLFWQPSLHGGYLAATLILLKIRKAFTLKPAAILMKLSAS